MPTWSVGSSRLSPGAQRGFTLLELLVVLVLLALVAGVVASRFSPLSGTLVLKRQAGELVAVLRHARGQAIAGGRTVTLEIADGGGAYRTRLDGDFTPLAEDIHLAFEPEAADLLPPPKGPSFHPDGTATGGAVVLTSSQGSAEIAVVWLTGAVALKE